MPGSEEGALVPLIDPFLPGFLRTSEEGDPFLARLLPASRESDPVLAFTLRASREGDPLSALLDSEELNLFFVPTRPAEEGCPCFGLCSAAEEVDLLPSLSLAFDCRFVILDGIYPNITSCC